jgi:hypothetical protein
MASGHDVSLPRWSVYVVVVGESGPSNAALLARSRADTVVFAVTSEPPGARITVDGDTVGVAPLTAHHRRVITGGLPQRIVVRALPQGTPACAQTRVIDYSVAVPETIRFDLHRCPAPDQDFSRIFSEEEVDELPERVSTPAMRYPPRAFAAGTSGSVIFEIVVDSTGRAEPASFQSLLETDEAFVSTARAIALRSVFQPGRVRGRRVRVRTSLTAVFVYAY